MRTFAKLITKIAFKIFFRVKVIGLQNVPEKGPAIVCANHNTVLDMFFLGFRLKRWIHWMAKEELFRNPVAAFILKKLGAFPVKRGIGDVNSIKNAYKLLGENKIVGIFPQGTRVNPQKIETVRVKPGAALIAANTGVPIIPAFVCGSYKLFSKVNVVFGEPFLIGRREGRMTKEELAEISKEIIRRVYSLTGAVK